MNKDGYYPEKKKGLKKVGLQRAGYILMDDGFIRRNHPHFTLGKIRQTCYRLIIHFWHQNIPLCTIALIHNYYLHFTHRPYQCLLHAQRPDYIILRPSHCPVFAYCKTITKWMVGRPWNEARPDNFSRRLYHECSIFLSHDL